MQSLLFTLALVAALIAYGRLKRVPESARKKTMLKAAVYGSVGLVILLALTGRLSPFVAVVAGLIPIAMRALSMWKVARKLVGASAVANASSKVQARYLTLEINHESGRVTGRVVSGPLVGASLDNLRTTQLFNLLDYYSSNDHASARLLRAFLDGINNEWRKEYREEGAHTIDAAVDGVGMTLTEASGILGVPEDAPNTAVVTAHKRLIQKLHPDRGGSSFLAAQVNLARQTMLDRR